MAAFEALMGSAYLEDIMVSDIMARCGLPRTVFYRHFRDKYDLMTHVYVDAIKNRVEISADKSWKNSILICYQYIYEKKNFFRHIVSYTGQNNFYDFLHAYTYNCNVQTIRAARRIEALDERLECSAHMYSSACGYLVKWWIDGGFRLTPQELCEIAFANLPVYLKDYLQSANLVLGAHQP